MSLVVVPLISGDAAGDAALRGVVERLLGGLETIPVVDGDRPREPVIVAALERDGWDAPAFRVWLDQGQLLLPVPAAPGGADDARSGVLRQALERVLEHDALVISGVDKDDQPRPGVAWVVVGVVPEAVADGDGVEAVLAGFIRASRWTDQAAEVISARRFGAADTAQFEVPGLCYLPWVLLPRPPRAAVVPAGLRVSPPRLGVAARPIIHTGLSGGGSLLTWAGAGKERLFADLVALHAISSSGDALRALLGSDEGVAFRTFHSATFEYPLRERILHARLGQILASGGGDASTGRLLPDRDGLDTARERAGPAIADRVTAMCGKIAEAIERGEVPEDRYAFDGTYPHQPRPGFTSLVRPGPGVWQGVLDEGRWPVFDPPRQAARLSRDVGAALAECARRDGVSVLETAMEGARETMNALRAELELTARGQLGRWQPPAGSSSSRLAHGIGATLALLGAVHDEAARHARTTPPAPDPAAQGDDAGAQLRASWEGEEDAMLAAGRSVPSRGGLAVEVAAGGLAVAGGVLSTLVFVVPPLIIGVLGAVAVGLLWRKRSAQITEYFGQWDGLGQRWLKEANAATVPVVARLNEQAREVKKLAAREFAGAVRTTEDRFRLEVRGFIHLVEGRHGVQARRRESEPRQRDAERLGRFRFVPEVGAESLDGTQRAAFDQALCNTLAASLVLSGMPERVTIAQYQAVLDQSLVSDHDERALVDAHRRDATATLNQALTFGLDVAGTERSNVDGFLEVDGARSIVVVGERVERRLEPGWEQCDLLTQVDAKSRPRLFAAPRSPSQADAVTARAVVGSMTPEVAVVLTVRSWKSGGVNSG